MSSLNKVQLMGRLGADPEMRRTQAGDTIANLRLATSETWRDKASGEKRERTEWHQVVIFNQRLAEVAEKYLKKGNLVFVEGMLCTRSWEDQSGQKRYTTEVVLKAFSGDLILMPQGNGGRPGAGSTDDYGTTTTRATTTRDTGSTPPTRGGFDRDLDDEIPF